MQQKLSPAVVVVAIVLALGAAALFLTRSAGPQLSEKQIEDGIAKTILKPGQTMPGGAPSMKPPSMPKK